jgi:hypothetical protein
MKSCCLTAFLLLIYYSAVYPQNYSNEAKDSTISQYDLKYGKKDKTQQAYFSYSAGYSVLFPDDKQPDPFLVHEAVIGYYFNRNWAVSLRFEFWISNYKYYYLPGTDLYQVINYKGIGTILNISRKFDIVKDRISLIAGFGIGNYTRSEGIEDYRNTGSYPTISLLPGLSYYPAEYLSIDCKGAYNMLFTIREGGRLKNISNVKLGVTYYVRF